MAKRGDFVKCEEKKQITFLFAAPRRRKLKLYSFDGISPEKLLILLLKVVISESLWGGELVFFSRVSKTWFCISGDALILVVRIKATFY